MSTPHPDAAPVPGADQTVRLGPGAGTGEETVRLDPRAAAEARTVRLDRAAAASVGGVDPEATVRLDSTEVESATFLDPRVWGGAPRSGEAITIVGTPAHGTPGFGPSSHDADAAPDADAAATVKLGATASLGATLVDVSPDEQPLGPGELRRFGPGVPPQAAAVWHGEAAPDVSEPRRPRRMWRWLVPVAVVLVVLALLFWRFHTPALAVNGVSVTTDPAGPGCGGTAVVTAAVETNGGAGTIRYRWLRSDGSTSDEIVQDVRSGVHRTDLVLRWSFEGQGSLQATTTLEILSPSTRTAAASFAYHCP
ncbi:hypothetical protein F7Q99_32820 [Streptomyces kaniharaensis]|uniref:Uncharacterized protein n=1 Tax=Streptomyces kaniharaensis TaxID=212423 RepID=A0A6N7L4P0_9ACTN|nr:hypothetical protein [Streptomyces kaniharaensis]MQS16843.1 hypothetical protein [Streptomyces kaniharaensis]